MGPSGSYKADLDVLFRSSLQFLDTKDFVHGIANGVAGDLVVSAGMAGDDTTAHNFAAKYGPAAKTVVDTIGKAGQGMAAISSRLLAMAASYLQQEDAVAGALLGRNFDSASGMRRAPECDPNEASAALPMVTGSKQVHEIPVIGKFWPQGDPDKLRQVADIWARCADLVDQAQVNAANHTAPIKQDCSGEAFDAFYAYAATVYTNAPQGDTAVSAGAPLLENVSASCRLLRNMCDDYAQAIDDCRTTLIELGVAAGLVAVGGVLLTVFTFGGSDVAAAGGEAALAAEAAAAAEALTVAEASAASAAAVAEAEAIVASAASRLIITGGVAATATAIAAVPADAAPGIGVPAVGAGFGAVGPVPPPVPLVFPLFDPAAQAAATTWVHGLPSRPPNYGTPDDQAYQVRVAGSPERQMSGAHGEQVWADGYRPADGAIIDAKNVRNQGCSPRSLQGLQEGAVNTGFVLGKDESELSRYQAAIDNPANHAQYLEIDTPDPATVGYWQFLAARNHVKNNVRYVP